MCQPVCSTFTAVSKGRYLDYVAVPGSEYLTRCLGIKVITFYPFENVSGIGLAMCL